MKSKRLSREAALRIGAIALAVAAAIAFLPGILSPPEPPPLAADIGFGPTGATGLAGLEEPGEADGTKPPPRAEPKAEHRKDERPRAAEPDPAEPEPEPDNKEPEPDRAPAVITQATSASAPPPSPAYVAPAPATAPAPPPAPVASGPPGDFGP